MHPIPRYMQRHGIPSYAEFGRQMIERTKQPRGFSRGHVSNVVLGVSRPGGLFCEYVERGTRGEVTVQALLAWYRRHRRARTSVNGAA